jgi:phosphatidylglycerophosphate synthase
VTETQHTTEPESYRETVARLASAQKGRAAGAPAFSLLVNRPTGRYLAAWAYRAGLTPNQVTLISAGFTFSGLAVVGLITPSGWSGLLVWVCLFLGYAFDSADGQVARLRGGGSLAGEWLDHVVDCVKASVLHVVVLIAAVRYFELDSLWWCLIPLGYLVIDNVSFFAIILNDSLKQIAGVPLRSPGQFRWFRSFLVLPTDYGILCLAFLALGWPDVFMTVYTLLFLATAGHTALALPKWFRDMRRIG